MSTRSVVAQHPVDEPVEKIALFGGQAGEETVALGKAVILQSIRPASSCGRDLHQDLAPDTAAAMQQAVGFQPIDETDGGRVGEADDGSDLANAGRRVVGGGYQGGDGRRRESGIPGERCVGDGKRQGGKLVRQMLLHVFPRLPGTRAPFAKGVLVLPKIRPFLIDKRRK